MEMNVKKCLLDYEVGTNFEPLMVEMSIRPPLFLTNPWLYFDGIISYLCMREALGEEYWTLPTHETVDISMLKLPLKKTKDLYHASVGLFNNPQLKKNKIYKRFTDKETYHLDKKLQKGKIRINSGYYKDFMINLPMIITDKIIFYCNGDKQHITELLDNLTNIGKKTSIGGGHIKKTIIKKTEVDYSFYKDNHCIKPLPSDMDTIPVQPGDTWKYMTYKPPYWDNSKAKLCRIPINQLTQK